MVHEHTRLTLIIVYTKQGRILAPTPHHHHQGLKFPTLLTHLNLTHKFWLIEKFKYTFMERISILHHYQP